MQHAALGVLGRTLDLHRRLGAWPRSRRRRRRRRRRGRARCRARLRVAARQAKLLMSGAPFFEVVDGFTNVDAKTLRARRGVRNPAPAAAAAFRAETEARREAAIAARRRGAAVEIKIFTARSC